MMAPNLVLLTQEEMIRRGAYGFLGRACECEIPVDKVLQVLPEPACENWGAYSHAAPDQPVEVKYVRDEDAYLLFVGLALLKEAVARGELYMPAFVEPDDGEIGSAARPRRSAGSSTIRSGDGE